VREARVDDRPIGVFDSGVGGLTVCAAVRDRLPGEHIIYFGDTGRFPYGTRSGETIIRYSLEIADYLVRRNVKMIVIACNTASAVALDTLRSRVPVPVMGVIGAGARAACGRMGGGAVGVIGTRATVASGSYVKAVQAVRPGTAVLQQHASLLVSLVEEGWTDDEVTRLAARRYIDGLYDAGVRTLILGCTHYPLLKGAIRAVYPDLDLVDIGVEIALEVQAVLREKNLENAGLSGTIELYASDVTDTMQRLKNLFFGDDGSVLRKLVISGAD